VRVDLPLRPLSGGRGQGAPGGRRACRSGSEPNG
jgi:hypothetical protein